VNEPVWRKTSSLAIIASSSNEQGRWDREKVTYKSYEGYQGQLVYHVRIQPPLIHRRRCASPEGRSKE
jgi:hypothetical protein